MRIRLRNMSIALKMALLGVGSVLITVTALVGLAIWQSGQYNELAQREVNELIDADLDHITQGIYNLVQTENEAVQQQINYDLNVARHFLSHDGGVGFLDETVLWTAINQFTGERFSVKLPKMLVGGSGWGRTRIRPKSRQWLMRWRVRSARWSPSFSA